MGRSGQDPDEVASVPSRSDRGPRGSAISCGELAWSGLLGWLARQEVENPSDARFSAVTVGAPTCNPAPCPTVLGTGGGKTIKVSVSTNFTFFTPIISALLGSSLQLNASATAVVQ